MRRCQYRHFTKQLSISKQPRDGRSTLSSVKPQQNFRHGVPMIDTQRSVAWQSRTHELRNALGAMIREGDDQMNTQTSNKAGLANNFWVQMAALVVVTVVIIGARSKVHLVDTLTRPLQSRRPCHRATDRSKGACSTCDFSLEFVASRPARVGDKLKSKLINFSTVTIRS